MKRSLHTLGAIVSAAAMAGCATTPPVKISYYLPRVDLDLTVTRTIGCDPQDNVIIATTVTPKVAYYRDPSTRHELRIAELENAFANSEVGVSLSEDGRLLGFNVSQTGQGGEVVKAAMAFLGAVKPAASDGAAVKEQCEEIRKVAKDKPITIVLSHRETFALNGGTPVTRADIPLTPTRETAAYYDMVPDLHGVVCVSTAYTAGDPLRVEATRATPGMAALKLRQPALATVTLTSGPGGNCKRDPVWSATIAVPQWGEAYSLPLPRAALFGKQTVKLELTESGAIKAFTVGRDTGAAAAIGAATEVVARLDETDAEELASVKAEADLIAQQQRLVRCRMNPQACT